MAARFDEDGAGVEWGKGGLGQGGGARRQWDVLRRHILHGFGLRYDW